MFRAMFDLQTKGTLIRSLLTYRLGLFHLFLNGKYCRDERGRFCDWPIGPPPFEATSKVGTAAGKEGLRCPSSPQGRVGSLVIPSPKFAL